MVWRLAVLHALSEISLHELMVAASHASSEISSHELKVAASHVVLGTWSHELKGAELRARCRCTRQNDGRDGRFAAHWHVEIGNLIEQGEVLSVLGVRERPGNWVGARGIVRGHI